MESLPTPSITARSFIVLTALLQGLLLYLAQTGIEQGFWPLSTLGGRVCWYTLVLSVPTVMTLTVRSLDEPRFWQHALGATLIFALLAAWAAWSATGDSELRASSVLAPFGFTFGLGVFIALPYLQCRLQHGRWCTPYDELFEWAWQNGLVLILTAAFTGMCWGVLYLCAALFKLIDIEFFEQLFRKQAFIYLATGVMAGLGILIGRAQPQAVRVARQILLAIFKGLLPMLALVALMFLISLPFTGLEALWKTRLASGTLFTLLSLMVLFVNAVFQDGRNGAPYPIWLRRVVDLAVFAMPVLALIALYALWLRIAQYGWTQDRYWAALVGVVLLVYSIGYAASALRWRGPWLQSVPRVNVVLSLVILGLITASNSPLLDPHRIAVASQLARLDPEQPDTFDARHLRFDSGRIGVNALQSLQHEERVVAQPRLRERIVAALESRLPDWERRNRAEEQSTPTQTQARERLRLASGTAPLPDDFLLALIGAETQQRACLERGADCVVLDPDLDQDGTREFVLCDLKHAHWVPCHFWFQQGKQWKYGDSMHSTSSGKPGVADALREGRYDVRAQRWSRLHVSGAEYRPSDN